MQWGNFRRSSNVEVGPGSGGGGGFRIGGGKLKRSERFSC